MACRFSFKEVNLLNLLKAPKSRPGQMLTVLYAIMGIPLYFAFAADLQDWIDNALFVWLYNLIFRKRRVKPKIQRWKKCTWMMLLAIIWLFLQGWITMVVFTMFYKAHFSQLIERTSDRECGGQWDYLTSVYFVFQSSALIGFGDLMTSRNLYLTVHLPMLIIGQVILTGLFTAMIVSYPLAYLICLIFTEIYSIQNPSLG